MNGQEPSVENGPAGAASTERGLSPWTNNSGILAPFGRQWQSSLLHPQFTLQREADTRGCFAPHRRPACYVQTVPATVTQRRTAGHKNHSVTSRVDRPGRQTIMKVFRIIEGMEPDDVARYLAVERARRAAGKR